MWRHILQQRLILCVGLSYAKWLMAQIRPVCPDCRIRASCTCGMHVSAVLRIEPINVSVDSTMDTHNSTSATETRCTKGNRSGGMQVHRVQRRGEASQRNPLASPGDVYFDMKEQAIYCMGLSAGFWWNQWMSMVKAETANIRSRIVFYYHRCNVSRGYPYIRLRRLPSQTLRFGEAE